MASAVGEKTQQRTTGIAWYFYNLKGKANKGKKVKFLIEAARSIGMRTMYLILRVLNMFKL